MSVCARACVFADYRENCTFDQNTFCTWTNSITDSTPNNDWTLKTGSTASSFTGPKSGHGGSGKSNKASAIILSLFFYKDHINSKHELQLGEARTT